MKPIAILLASAGLALGALPATPVAAQVEGTIATADRARAMIGSQALQSGFQQIETTYSAQLEQLRAKQQQRQSILKQFDTDGDNEIDDNEYAAVESSPEFQTLQTLDQELAGLSNEIELARVFVVEQIAQQYIPALREVAERDQVKVVLNPGALALPSAEADITQDVVTSLNAKVPSVGVVPPEGYQPSRQGVQLTQEIEQTLQVISLLRQQQAAQQGQQPQQQTENPPVPQGR
ncbi:OmpH family outer membrane protein [Erythrobacter sp. HL-111]|uniref:OmpH family outer membrane protein n=1 Tax=Erythrobacter sp. HL-111 TaxID=1798193 RepID=UPI0006DBA3BB|nr:OmpH family outer membrane protein [Erythrobacter sp. HL-111]KPP96212.1 MAG: Outer membrane protein [Erythrobacteraceae bacterium HL-111]SDR77843.1 periplasmic chaperone for outer membrane proteins Skp [Erythrobacter sp. HL-111]